MADDTSARAELTTHFGTAVSDHPEVMAECLSLLRLYSLEPSTLFFKHEAFVMSRPSGLRAKLSNFNLDTVRELRKEIQREQQARAVASAVGSPAAAMAGNENTPRAGMGMRKGKGNLADLGGFLDGLSTPSRPKSRPSTSSALPARLSNTSNNANVPSPPAPSSFTPSSAAAFATPSRPGPATPAAASSSSYRPGPSQLALPSAGPSSSTPTGKSANGHLSAPSSPVSGNESPGVLTPQPAQPFHLRPQPNSLIETLNPHMPSSTSLPPPNHSRPRVALSSTADPKAWSYRYMFEKISARSESLDDLIDDFAETMKSSYGLSELGDPHFVSEESIYAVGRILSAPTDSSKVNANSLFLESSRFLGGGKRVALQFRQGGLKVRGGAPGVKGFGVFPGCLVCVKGKNGGGGVFVVDEVLMPPPSAMPTTPAEELLDYQHGEKMRGQPVSMMSAAGPFTLDDDLAYEPLEALINVAIDERPDVLVLLGPFVDTNHPLIASGAVTSTPTEIFKSQITSRLQRLADASPGTYIILIPSVRDLVSRHVAFPQAMLDKEALGLPKKIKSLPNPCTFSVNEVIISVSSVDVLFHLRREEVLQRAEEADPDASSAMGPEVKDAMAGLVRHVLGQKSFYPIFPPPEQLAHEVNLDVTHAGLVKMEDLAPDVLILPSKLKHFSKIVDSTLVINPAHLARAHSAGTFAKVLVHPTPREKLEEAAGGMDVDGEMEGMMEHGIWERARSEIWRI